MSRKRLFTAFVLLAICGVSLIVGRVMISSAAKDKTYSEVDLIPYR
jgi:hypothetical protein